MASKAVNLEKQVECPICLEQYKEPKVLSCLHSYCKSCLQKYVTKSGDSQHKIACPECRQETQVPNGDVGKLQGNFWVNNFISLLSISSTDKQKTLICENCDSGDTAVSRCTECCVFMCEFCVTAHQRMHTFKHHQIVPMEKVKSGSPKALIKPLYCEKHGGEVLKLFCQTCDKPICRDCTIVDHQGHKYAFVTDAATKEKDHVRKLLEKTKIKAPALANGVKSVEEMEKRVKAKERAVAQEIDALKNKQVRALEEIFAKLQLKAKTISQAKLKQLEAQREGLMIALACVNNSVEFTERALKDGGDVEVLSMKKQLVTNLSKLSSSTWECEPCEEDTFQLTVHQNISQVAANIATVDDIRVVPEGCTVTMVGGESGVIYDTLAGQRREFTVVVWNNFGKQSRGQKVRVSVIGPGTQHGQSSDIKVTVNRDGSYSFAFVPKQQGCYQLRVQVCSRDIPGSPFQWNVVPPVQVSKPEVQCASYYSGQAVNYVLGSANYKGVLSMGVSRCKRFYGQATPADVSHAAGAPLNKVRLNQGTLSWKVKICERFTQFGNTHKRSSSSVYSSDDDLIWAIESTGKHYVKSTCTSGWGTPVQREELHNIKSWQAGDVFVLFLNMDTRKLIIQNLRTSETSVFDGIKGTISPYLNPNDPDIFSLDV